MLEGLRVLVTRPRERAEQWIVALQAANAEVLYLPVFDLAPLEAIEARNDALQRVADVAVGGQPWLAFTSVPAVHHFVQLLGSEEGQARGTGELLDKFQFAAVGEATAEALRELGFELDLIASEPTAAALAKDLLDRVPLPFEVVHPTSDRGLGTLTDELRQKGVRVERLEIYRQVPLAVDVDSLFRGDEPPHVLTFASPSAVQQFLLRASEETSQPLVLAPGCCHRRNHCHRLA